MTDQSKPISRPRRKTSALQPAGADRSCAGDWGLAGMDRAQCARIQREAVKAIRQSGGWVSYYSEMGKGNLFLGENPGIRKWLSDFIGIDYFDHVSSVMLDPHSPTSHSPKLDATIAQVGRLTELDSLFLSQSSVSGSGLAHIKGLTNLSSLDLFGTGVNDAGLAHLEGLTALSTLELRATQVTDNGLANLKRLTKLNYLGLAETQVTDAGLVHLKWLVNLSLLDLSCTQITDAGLAHLKGLTKLRSIDLSNTQVTDDAAEELQQALPSLVIAR